MTQDLDQNRLRMEMDRALRDSNKRIINPEIPDLHLDDLTPTIEIVARARAAYLKELFSIAEATKDGLPSPEQVASLRAARGTYEELVHAIRALEAALERGYLDVKR